MKKLLLIGMVILSLGLFSSPTLAAKFSTIVSDIFPLVGETIEVEVWIREMEGSEIESFDTCLKYDSYSFDVESMQINDTSVGGCFAAAFSITNDNGTDCVRLGGGVFPGTTCEMVNHEYLLATVVFEFTDDNYSSTDLCTGDCDDGYCGHYFNDYVEDETGKQYPSVGCRSINYP